MKFDKILERYCPQSQRLIKDCGCKPCINLKEALEEVLQAPSGEGREVEGIHRAVPKETVGETPLRSSAGSNPAPASSYSEEVNQEIEHFRVTKVPRCSICKKDYKRINQYEWKPSCEHNKYIRMSMG